ncbi:BolA family protein [Halobaculum sp. MBLA0147]|uniref:BolA family protein n=1 Tax=Halobaculum sp. MBLA0147 TaxID=3079934 RepID=UPI0035258C1E
MDATDVAEAIEAGIEDASAEVTNPRVHDDETEDAHYAAVVVSPAFAGESIVDRHQMVYDAVGDAMTTEVHALEITTYTPEEYDEG